jgi:2-polyprenyl-3-methyl-5-hydroxy-6-metoxy-1,4-benzoquinol methylase
MHPSYDSDEAIRRWDLHARHIATYMDPEEGDPHRIVLLNPALFQLLPDVNGKRVLDAGCGEGYLCRKLARLGARVTGVDFSREMLAIAGERTDPELDIRYRHGNCEHLDFLDAGSFDVVVSNMVLMDLADHRAALQGMHRVLVEGGILIFSILHPCFVTPGCGWVKGRVLRAARAPGGKGKADLVSPDPVQLYQNAARDRLCAVGRRRAQAGGGDAGPAPKILGCPSDELLYRL